MFLNSDSHAIVIIHKNIKIVWTISGIANPGNAYTKNIGIKIDIREIIIHDIPIRKLSDNKFFPNKNIEELYPIKYKKATIL